MSVLRRIVEEPPFRLPAYFLVKRFARSVRLINRWGAVDRPHYLAGVLAAADMAKAENIKEISVFEFGVAGGSGLVRLQEYAQMVEEQTGVNIHVFGFDTGEGLPLLCNDYRDHPDQWRVSDYKMDVPKLRERLTPRTGLYLGNITDTVPDFVAKGHPPVGFIACDVDLYSSTRDVLKIFTLPGRKMLRRVFMYFDDIDFVFNHQFAGEWLAIDEFNEANALVKIDVWRGIRKDRVFFDEPWLDKMFIAHDLDAINKFVNNRSPSADCVIDCQEAVATRQDLSFSNWTSPNCKGPPDRHWESTICLGRTKFFCGDRPRAELSQARTSIRSVASTPGPGLPCAGNSCPPRGSRSRFP